MFKDRSTTDIVVILFTLMIGVAITMTIVGILFIKVQFPQTDVSKASEFVGNVITTVVGALVGFIGGRATGRAEGANGNGAKHP